MITRGRTAFACLVAITLALAPSGLLAGEPSTRVDKSGAEEGETAVWASAAGQRMTLGPAASFSYTNSTPVTIPDTGCGSTTTSVINVPDSYFVGSVTVGVCITHAWRGDLRLYLLGPDGTQVPLIVNQGSSGANLNVTFDDASAALPNTTAQTVTTCNYPTVWKPSGTLGTFRFKPVAGNWTLQMCDSATPDAGTLNQWTLTFNDVAPGVYFAPTTNAGYACPGSQIAYGYSVTNFTGGPASIGLSYASAWPATGPSATAVLAQGASEAITVRAKVDSAALPGSTDTLTVTGSAAGYTGSATATSTANAFGGWQDFADLPSYSTRGTRWNSIVYSSGKLYKIGGYNATSAAVRPYLDIYDIATNTWSAGPDMPGNRTGIDAVVIGGKIYVAGGGTASGGTAQTTLYIFDIAANTWSTGAVPLQTARMDYAGVAIGTKYYLIGGYSGTTYLNTMVSYDTATNTWDTTLPSMSVARRWGSAGVIGGKIYVAGGFSSSTVGTLATQVYDPALNTWSSYASLPSSLPGGASGLTGWINAADGVLQNRYLILAGGYMAGATASSFSLLYDSVANTWGPLLPYMNHQLYGAEGDSDGTNFWIASGRQADPSFHDGEKTTRLNLCASPAPVLNFQSAGLVDTCITVPTGDHDGVVDPGEALELAVTLTNTGNTSATGISATLSTTTPGVTVTTPTASYPDIPDFPTNTGAPTAPFAVTVSASVPCGTRIAFSLAVTTDQGSFTLPFSLLVGALQTPVNLFTESFDGATTVPPAVPTDWATTVVTPGASAPTWTTATAGTHPATTPPTAPNLALFNSYTCTTGSQILLYRQAAVDLSTYGAASLSFQMYHDTGYTNLDKIQVQVSTDGGSTWTPVGDAVNRYLGAGINQWRSHTVDLSAYAGNASVMVGLLATSAYGDDIHIDGISVDGQTVACHICPACIITACDATVPAQGVQGQVVSFVATDTTFPCSGTEYYLWSFDYPGGGSGSIGSTSPSVNLIFGTVGLYPWTLTVTVDGDTCTDSGTIQICPLITLSPATLPDATIGTAYAQTLTAAGGTAPYSFAVTAGTLPTGLSLTAGGALAGIPTAPGSYPFTVTATDAGGCTASQAYTLTVTCPTITLSPTTLPGGVVGSPYSATLTASGGHSPYTFAVTSGTLPAGLTLGTDGSLTGTLASGGAYSFTVTATDAYGCTGTATYTTGVDSFDLGFLDDAGATQLCLNTYNGTYAFTIFSGTGAGTYAGLCTVAPGRLGMMVVASYGSRTVLSGTYSPLRHVAQATFTTPGRGTERAGGILVPKVLKATLNDSNTLDDPPCGGGEPAR